MYSSIAKTRLIPGEWLAIPGAGGGLGHMCVHEHLLYCLFLLGTDSFDVQGYTDCHPERSEGYCNRYVSSQI